MNKNILIIVAVGAVVLLLGGWYWSTQQQPFQPRDSAEVLETEELIGGQEDEHGCLVAAGYSWCEAKNKCLRTWEEACDTQSAEIAAEIKQALVEKHGSVAEGVEVSVVEVRDIYARGSAREEFGGGMWFAVLEGGRWIIVADGNGVPECVGFDRYAFPTDMYGSCLEVSGEVRDSI